MGKQLVIIPTYNEIDNIEQMLDEVVQLEANFDVLIVDDNSPDGTAEVVKRNMAVHDNRIFLLERRKKQGLGTAYI
ncbi:MAG: glycosyltransferase, partial [Bacteroidota bacterium]|nr:glycosyltransferase [Bacteroidota bacterium]